MTLLTALLLGAALLPSAGRPDDTLSVGDDAPALTIDHFVKGERVDAFPDDKVTVVEFWATWCKPCIDGFPHLSELQERHAEDVVVIGVSAEPLDTVEAFLAKPRHADVTRYRMASDPDGSMQADWMVAAGRAGIPCAFIVDRAGIVRYIGHPMAMDRVLEQVISGRDPDVSEPLGPALSDAERAALTTVAETHSPEAAAYLDSLRAELSAPDGVLDFEQELVLRGALRMGGPDGEAHDMRKTRAGVLSLGPRRSGRRMARVEASRTMALPGMPGEGLTETETLLYQGDRILMSYKSESPFMPSPIPTDGWTAITRAEARSLADQMPIPLPLAALMEVNPVVANPLDLLDALLEMSALEVVREPGPKSEDDTVLLAGPAAPLAGIPIVLESSGPIDDRATNLPTLRLEFVPGSGDLSLQVGQPGSPSLEMKIHRRTLVGPPASELFLISEGDETPEPQPLLPILRERMATMRAMGAPVTK